jgi:hypothetical protein
MWLPLPNSDAFQTITIESIKTAGEQEILCEREYGNRVLFLKLGPSDSKLSHFLGG